jgi:uncharacterized protein YndB with AHSA1/START domain
MKVDEKPVIVEETFSARIDIVWKSITEVDLMRQWYFENIPAFKPEVGFETQFNVRSQGRDFLHKWRVTEVVPMERITYNWKFEGYPGDSFVMFELSRLNSSTKLRLTCIVKESFPDDIPEFSRESCLAGWKHFISQSLKEFLKRKL